MLTDRLTTQSLTEFHGVDTFDESDATLVDPQNELAVGPSELRSTALLAPDPLSELPDFVGVAHGPRILHPAVRCKAVQISRATSSCRTDRRRARREHRSRA